MRLRGNENTSLHIRSAHLDIVIFNVPGKRFARNGILQYENGSVQTKFFDYHFIIYAYSNFSTSELLGFNVGRPQPNRI